MVGPGKLNWIVNLLIVIGNFPLEICLEYLLEHQKFPHGCRGSDKPLAYNFMLECDDIE